MSCRLHGQPLLSLLGGPLASRPPATHPQHPTPQAPVQRGPHALQRRSLPCGLDHPDTSHPDLRGSVPTPPAPVSRLLVCTGSPAGGPPAPRLPGAPTCPRAATPVPDQDHWDPRSQTTTATPRAGLGREARRLLRAEGEGLTQQDQQARRRAGQWGWAARTGPLPGPHSGGGRAATALDRARCSWCRPSGRGALPGTLCQAGQTWAQLHWPGEGGPAGSSGLGCCHSSHRDITQTSSRRGRGSTATWLAHAGSESVNSAASSPDRSMYKSLLRRHRL